MSLDFAAVCAGELRHVRLRQDQRPGFSQLAKMSRGTQCRGAKPDRANLASSASAADKTFGLMMIIALSAGPFLSYAAMRSRYIWTSCRHVSCAPAHRQTAPREVQTYYI